MRKPIAVMLAGLVLLFGTALPGFASGSRGGARSGSSIAGGHPGQRGAVIVHGGHRSVRGGHPGFRSAHRFRSGHGFRGHHGFRGRTFVGARVFIGPTFWGPPAWGPTYVAPPVIVQQTPPVHVPAPTAAAPAYWYYCQSPQGYYPYVSECPGGWMTVLPQPAPPPQ